MTDEELIEAFDGSVRAPVSEANGLTKHAANWPLMVVEFTPVVLLFAGYVSSSFWLRSLFPETAWIGVPGRAARYGTILMVLTILYIPSIPVIYGVKGILATLRKEKPPTWSGVARRYLSPGRLAIVPLTFLLIVIFANSFNRVKTIIPIAKPFRYDSFLLRLDRALHGGTFPHEFTHRFLGPGATYWLDAAYSLWPVLVFVCVPVAVVWTFDRQFIRQFFCAYMVVWIVLGLAMASLMPAAGPAFFERVVGDPAPYGSLMTVLDGYATRFDLDARVYQEYLWEAYSLRAQGVGTGIMAMPSLHIAISVLWVVASWKRNKFVRLGAIIFALIMLVGSVHLGWHYAVDGYVSVVAVPLIWHATARLLCRFDSITEGAFRFFRARQIQLDRFTPQTDAAWAAGPNLFHRGAPRPSRAGNQLPAEHQNQQPSTDGDGASLDCRP